MADIYDFVIIGSGPSGGVLAYNLCKAGARVLMLEAGKAHSAKTFPRNEMTANASLMWSGGMDTSTDAGLLFLRGKVLGGGSIINQCLLDRFDDNAFDDWRARTGVDFYSSSTMSRHYDEVESHLALHTMEKCDWNRNAELYVEGFDKCGMEWAPLRRGQSNCGQGNDCVVCLGGCPRDSKQSSLVTFIKKAQQHGLEIETEFNVSQIIHGTNLVTVYGDQYGAARQVYGRRCIVAGGALGSTQMLLKSGFKDKLPGLGSNFTCHPQFMNIALFDEIVDAHKGAFQSVKSQDPRFRQQGFKLENVFAGPIAVSLLKPGFGLDHQRFMQKYRNMACIEVAIRDATAGTINIDKSGRLKIKKTMADADWQRANAGIRVVETLFNSLGARDVMKSPIKIGLHLMGGCTLGKDGRNSVVNEHFQVHDHPNVFIADSSIFPSAPGINPSLSIMALAHKASEHILAECGVSSTAKIKSKSPVVEVQP
ncbi:GMC family oxidoreductase N-terminal domain-containing protein [Alkalimarinus alittae]|uniref:GMC family oxidoreductase n=1 Tax=Alkalimarinus alittae TaxID=2961619 RepID=A0ABY6N3C5_9ALTE|nr:GMC family oxidoreductase [Alkalimarinus alittae]UZE96606.1 GMC family oxidoreductase [Alkalimarinus alittae]